MILILALVVAFIIRRWKRGGKHLPHTRGTSEYLQGQPTFPGVSPTSADFSRNTYYVRPPNYPRSFHFVLTVWGGRPSVTF